MSPSATGIEKLFDFDDDPETQRMVVELFVTKELMIAIKAAFAEDGVPPEFFDDDDFQERIRQVAQPIVDDEMRRLTGDPALRDVKPLRGFDVRRLKH